MEDFTSTCRLCRTPLHPVHGRLACLNSACPMFGVDQGECCGGGQSREPVRQPPPIPYEDRD